MKGSKLAGTISVWM